MKSLFSILAALLIEVVRRYGLYLIAGIGSGFQAFVAGIALNRVVNYLWDKSKELWRKLRNTANAEKIHKEMSKENQDEQAIKQAGKDFLEGKDE